jgi:short-subunit dehydrogenase
VADQVSEQGGKLEVLKADVTSPADRERMVETAARRFGGLDILVNNAGIGATGHFADADPQRLYKIMEVNFLAVAELIRQFLPFLRRGNRPAIVNISSIVGKRGIPARSEYSASKFALQGFSEALRGELSKDGIDVLVVSPGLTRTGFSENMLEQKARLSLDHMRGMTPEKVAAATLRAIERGRAETCLTLRGKLLVLVNRLFPRLVDKIVALQVRKLYEDQIKHSSPRVSASAQVQPVAGIAPKPFLSRGQGDVHAVSSNS